MDKVSFYYIKKIMIFVLGICLLISFAACKPSENEFKLISNANCYPPCWANIIPGITTKEEVITILNKNSITDPNSVALLGKPWNTFNDIVEFKTTSNDLKGEIYFVKDIVVIISLFGRLNISFSKASEELGEPEYIVNIPLSYPVKSNEIFALLPKNGVNFAYNTHDQGVTSKITLTPENKITRVDFFDSNYFDYLLEAGIFSEGFLNSSETKIYMIPWNGYGEIAEKYPPAIIEFK